jgi:CHAT domain-containing protein
MTPTAFPLNCLQTGRNLGNLAFTEGNWQLAIAGYSQAIAAVEQSRTWATNDERRKEILAESIDIYEKMVQACINNGQLGKAIEYAERSRSQRLVDLMASNDLYAGGDIPPQVQEYLQQFADKQWQIDQLRQGNNPSKERELAGSTRRRAKVEEDNEIIQALEQEKHQIWQQICQLDPVLSGQIQVAAPNLAAMQTLIDDDKTAILSFYTTTDNTYVFVLRKDGVSCHSCQGQGGKVLQGWIIQNWLKPYVFDKPAWSSNIGGVLGELAHRLRLSELVAEYLEGIEELIIVPHLYLHQIPFGALPLDLPTTLTQQGILSDQFLIRYVPSCQILDYCRNRPPVTSPTAYGTVEDATEDLPCSSFEGEQIAQLYQIPENRRHRGCKDATVANYRQLAKQVQGILSTHHAQSRLDNPLESELLLADGSITLAELLTPGWRLPQLVDVFLSCCETGLGLPKTLTDDILTLSFGFLCAGARSVVSTLWAVDDLATALFSLFYHRYKESLSRPAALRKAQEELRTLTGETLATKYKPLLLPLLNQKQQQTELALERADTALDGATEDTEDYWQNEYDRISETLEKVEGAIKRLDCVCKEAFPFSDYFYWSAFTCQGLR